MYSIVQLTHISSARRVQIIVFFPTARQTGFMAALFGRSYAASLGFNVVEIHSRKSQSARDKASETFRAGRGVALFSSDVTARGMDYPDVSLVVQVRFMYALTGNWLAPAPRPDHKTASALDSHLRPTHARRSV